MAKDRLSVAIVGGGIGGLATALFLHHRGIDVTVYEQAPELGEVGAGVMMTPNGRRPLEELGLGPAIDAAKGTVSTGSTYYRMDGTKVGDIVTTDSAGWNGMCGMHRADLLFILADALPKGLVRTGHRCNGVEQDQDGVRVSFENGATAEADLVVGADGIHSVLRGIVTEPTEPVYSGSVAYRGLIDATRLPDWPVGVSTLWMGEGKHFLVFPVRSGKFLNYVGFVPSAIEALESWSAPGDADQLRREFAGWDPRVTGLLDQVEQTYWWGLFDRDPLQTWTQGRIALMGDAAHPMLPHLGQGANQSIEDGAALALMLSQSDRASVPATLKAYEAFRSQRAGEVQLQARQNGLRYDSRYENLEQRDREIAASQKLRFWLHDYDITSSTTELLRAA
jgi:salicylate hydroxylase